MSRRHLLGLEGMTAAAIEDFIARARDIKERSRRGETIKVRKASVANLFFEASTRTKTSFELAERRLGLEAVSLAVASSSVSKGETLLDTVENLRAMGVSVFVVRHQASGVCEQLTHKSPGQFINAGDGLHEHPSQGLLDVMTLRERLGPLEGRTICIIGDIRHSRVARSNLWALTALGANVSLFGPPTLVPRELERNAGAVRVRIFHDFTEAVANADAVIVLRLQRERMAQGFLPSLADYTRGFGLTKQRAALLKPQAIIMHPGPINRGVEIDDEVASSERSVVLEQVENGVFMRMAILQWLLEGEAA